MCSCVRMCYVGGRVRACVRSVHVCRVGYGCWCLNNYDSIGTPPHRVRARATPHQSSSENKYNHSLAQFLVSPSWRTRGKSNQNREQCLASPYWGSSDKSNQNREHVLVAPSWRLCVLEAVDSSVFCVLFRARCVMCATMQAPETFMSFCTV
jgi:hypothetical protein